MTIKELKQNILLSLYHRYKGDESTNIGLKDLCEHDHILFDSLQQVSDAAKGLKESGYINLTLFMGGDGHISGLTPSGIEYVEKNLLSVDDQIIDGLSDTDKMMRSGNNVNINVGQLDNERHNVPSDNETNKRNYFYATEQYRPIVDKNATPCFGVDSLADCYARQIDEIVGSKTESTRMLGIFGPWGRGKTYFFNRLRMNLEDNTKHSVKYKIVEFNAWKYQETPALWAYLYETMYKSASIVEKLLIQIKSIWNSMLTTNFLLYWIILFIAWGIEKFFCRFFDDTISQVLNYLNVPAVFLYLLGGIIHLLKERIVTAKSMIKKYTKRKSYTHYLGIQNEIEEDLQILLQSMVRKVNKSRVILYIDDIDRCNSHKLISIIESLRTILENSEIQERLVVICSVDESKLMKAYEMEFKENGYTNEEIEQYKREQLDKLFIFGVKLPTLDSTQLNTYLSSLIKDSSKANTDFANHKLKSEGIPFSTYRKKESLVATAANGVIELNDENIKEIFQDFLMNHGSKIFTPRKIRIMYYQLLFALSLSAKGGGAFTDRIAETMLMKSVGLQYDHDKETAMSDIIDMAVPY
ncbi:P-loop NTPase fold protein [Prevotella sp.]|uniref:P-loop NTPase fold protein n=1 Tax=Prevotella sp. TaxID=59823 RepID=UPI0027E23001|nr:P-loop NTPase fold protein [Prevotella sp.]